MSDDKDRLTHDELVAVLQRAVARQAQGEGRSYTLQDLEAAAKDLGLETGLVRETAREHLARREAQTLAPPPFDTRVDLRKENGTLRLTIPPLRAPGRTAVSVGMVGFWFAFLTLWTVGAARGSALFAAFSAPFWIAGFAMLGQLVTSLVRTTILELGPVDGYLLTKPGAKKRTLRLHDLRVRLGDDVRSRHKGGNVGQAAAPAVLLEHGTETIPLLVGFSEQEQRWVHEELRAWLPSNQGSG
jgi:hypothetical protein